MSKFLKITSQEELEQLIERYFEGVTSLQEEQLLMKTLEDCDWNSETIDEARFTIGYIIAHKQQHHATAMRSSRMRVTAIAASIAVLLTIGVTFLWQHQPAQDVCVAYVNSKVIQNEKEVMMLIKSDLNEISNASQGLTDQMFDLGETIELDS